MSEPISQTIQEGYKNWRTNLILGVPHLTSIILSILIFIFICIAAGVLLGLQHPQGDFGQQLNLKILILPAMGLLVGFVLTLFITSYFCAAGIGMSMKAIETGKTKIGDMFSYGSRNVMSIFISLFLLTLASIIILVILFAPAGWAYSVKQFGLGTGLAIAGGILYMLYLAVIIFFYTMAPVAMVVKNIDSVEGIREGFRFAVRNKLRLFLFWGFYFLISQLFGFLFLIVSGPLNYVNYISPVIYGILFLGLLLGYFIVVFLTLIPIFYVYLTRLYLESNVGIKRTVSKPYEHARNPEQSSTPRKLYI